MTTSVAMAVALSAAIGCQAFLTFDEQGTAGDGGGSTSVSSDGGVTSTSDAKIVDDATLDAVAPTEQDCSVIVDDDFQGANKGWLVLGNASIDGGVATITPDDLYMTGAIWYRVEPPVTSLRATFDMLLANKFAAGYGLTFAWAGPQPDGGAPGVGDVDQGFGLCNGADQKQARAVLFETNADSPLMMLLDVKVGQCSQGDYGSCVFGPTNQMTIDVSGTGVRATVTGAKLTQLAKSFPTTHPPIAWVGFTGSTGQDLRALHQVDHVTIRSCPP